MKGVALAGIGLVSGWGEGLSALPEEASSAAAGRLSVAAELPAPAGERFRRATRECLLGVGAVEALLGEVGLARAALAGEDTALIYVTAGAYGAANREFIEAAATAGAIHFPYTAPSAVPAEVAIEFGIRGRYVILLGGATTMIEALAQAAILLNRRTCERALVLAVETFAECQDLYARARWLLKPPLVEAAACALLVPGGGRLAVKDVGAESPREGEVRRRAGETFACAPLIALALARAGGDEPLTLTGQWGGRRLELTWHAAGAGAVA